MKKITLLFAAVTAFAFTASAQYNVTITSAADGGFANAPSANLSLPAAGETSSASVTDNSLFFTQFINGLGNVDTYKSGLANTAVNTPAANAWASSGAAQSFSINVVGSPTAHGSNAGPRWRAIRSINNGSTLNGTWSNITAGENTISLSNVSVLRMVGFQIAGVVAIDSFTHSWTGGSDSLSVAAVAVPEVSHFGLLTGVVVLAFAARRRRA
jgi:hypothetical protein